MLNIFAQFTKFWKWSCEKLWASQVWGHTQAKSFRQRPARCHYGWFLKHSRFCEKRQVLALPSLRLRKFLGRRRTPKIFWFSIFLHRYALKMKTMMFSGLYTWFPIWLCQKLKLIFHIITLIHEILKVTKKKTPIYIKKKPLTLSLNIWNNRVSIGRKLRGISFPKD